MPGLDINWFREDKGHNPKKNCYNLEASCNLCKYVNIFSLFISFFKVFKYELIESKLEEFESFGLHIFC